jgi:glutamate racemase
VEGNVNSGIGVIDSGVGGLTVAREIMRQLPRESIFYFGDTARCPYGPRPADEVWNYTNQMVAYLMKDHIKALVVACNTATAVVLPKMAQQVNIPIVGVIEPGARTAIKETKNEHIGVIGTVGTIQSGAYEKALKRLKPDVQVFSLACPEFVPLVELGVPDRDAARRIIANSLSPLKEKPIDTLILGCTHYPLLADLISKEMGDGVKLISSAEETARELSAVLSYKGLLVNGNGATCPKHKFYTSGKSEVFKQIALSWVKEPLQFEQINLEKEIDCTISWTKS